MKKIIALLIALIFIVSCVPAFAAEPVMYEKFIINDTYTDGTSGTISDNNTTTDIIEEGYTYSGALENPLLKIGGNNSCHVKHQQTSGFGYSQYVIRFDIYFPVDGNTFRLHIRGLDGSNFAKFFRMSKNQIISDSTVLYTISEPKEHYNVEIHMDLSGANDKVDVYLDGVLVIAAHENSASYSYTDLTQLRLYNEGDGDTYSLIDNFQFFSKLPGPSFLSSPDVTYDTEKIDFELSGNLVYDSLNTDSLKLISSDGEVELSEINIDSAADGIVSVYPKYNLDSNTNYTVTINENAKVFDTQNITTPISCSFTTQRCDREVLSNAWSQVTSGDEKIITFSAELDSDIPGDDICIILTIWNGDTLVGIKVHNYTYDDIQTDSHVSLSLGSAQTGYKATAIAVTDINSPQRVGKPIYEYLVE